MVALLGSVHERATPVFRAAAVNPDGAAGTPNGVAVACADAAPTPAVFTERSTNLYAVSFTSPVTVCEAVVAVVLIVAHALSPVTATVVLALT